MKQILSILMTIALCLVLVACGSNESPSGEPTNTETVDSKDENKAPNGKIVMPYSAADYCGEEWTLEELIAHLTELGFTNIETTACDPSNDNYKSYVFEIYIETGLFSTDPWEAGEEYNADSEISIYYNEFPVMTIDNSPDLVKILTSKDISYMSFANSYDGRYVEFDAYVTEHLTYDGGTSHIIEVTGGDYDGIREIDPYNPECFDGLIIRIGDRSLFPSINESVQAGDNVRVVGTIDAEWSDFFNCLYVETMSLQRR